MAATLYRTNGHVRVWAMTNTRYGHVVLDPVSKEGKALWMTTDELRALVHDIQCAQREVDDYDNRGAA